MQINIPLGTEINKIDNNIIKIRIPNTHFWIQGEKKNKNKWDTYLIDPQSSYKEPIKKNFSTLAFAILSSTILKTPFPYTGKRAENRRFIKKFINKLNKTKNELTRTKNNKLQNNRKRHSKNESNLTKTINNHKSRKRHKNK